MNKVATTRMSSRGQIVIPEDIRVALGLGPGAQFVVVGQDDVVILKRIAPPVMSDFDEILGEARRQARRVGMKRSDIAVAIQSVRDTR